MSAPTILLIEDNPITRRLLRATLEAEQYCVREAGDARTALEALDEFHPALVLQDYMLPDMDGAELARRIRSGPWGRDLPIVLLTAAASQVRELAGNGLFTTALLKPTPTARLLETVRSLLAASDQPLSPASWHLLVVDDDPMHLNLAQVQLGAAGHRVTVASGGEEALREARRLRPDVVLADVLMPGLDGFGLCLAIRSAPELSGLPVVLVSAAPPEEADRRLALEAGASDLVPRSAGYPEALEAVERAVREGARPLARPGEQLVQDYLAMLRRQMDREIARQQQAAHRTAIQAAALSTSGALAQALSRPHDMGGVLGTVLVQCLDATGLATGLLYLRQRNGGARLHAAAGFPDARRADAEAVFGHPELLDPFGDGEVLALHGARAVEPAHSALLAGIGRPFALVVPFIVLGRHYGSLVLGSIQHDLGDEAWLSFARTLASQFGQAVALGQTMTDLAETEELIRQAVDASPNGMLTTDEHGVIVMANRQIERIFGHSEAELLGRPVEHLIPVRLRGPHSTVRGAFHVAPATRNMGEVEVVGLHKDGREIPLEVGLAPVVRPDRTFVIASVIDITQRKQSEQALAEGARHAALAADVGLALTQETTLGRTLQRCTQAAVDRLDLSFAGIWTLRYGNARLRLKALSGREVAPTWAEQVVPLGKYPIGRIAAEGAPYYRGPADGDPEKPQPPGADPEGPVMFVGQPLVVEERVVGVLAVLGRRPLSPADLDAVASLTGQIALGIGRHWSQEALEESEARFRSLIEASFDGVFVSTDGIVREVNSGMARMLGWPQEEMIGRPVTDFVADESLEEVRRRVGQNVEGRYDVVLRHRDGRKLMLEATARTVLNRGRPTRVTALRDVTEKRQLEEQFRQAQKMEAVGRLAGGVAHDFNNLLTVITGYTGMLLDDLTPDHPHRADLEQVSQAATAAAGLTRQLLAFSRRQVIAPRLLTIEQVVTNAEKLLRRLIGEDVQLMTVLSASPATVRIDPGQLEQVIMNLSVNARDAMPSGGKLTIETGWVELDEPYAQAHFPATPGRYAMLAVTDTGVGMDAATRARIFEPFFTTKEAGKGTGLGLATVYGIVKQNGGFIWVYSEPGRGTTFKIYLPRLDEQAQELPPRAPQAPRLEGRETVLLVEDAPPLRAAARLILSRRGYTVLEAGSAEEALDIAARHTGRIHLLLTDVVMPGLSGPQLAEKFRAVSPSSQVLYMSGYTDDSIVRHGVLASDVAYLQKPFSPETLLLKIREVLGAPAED